SQLHIADRGLIKEGLAADLAMFDPATIADRATFTNPFQYAVGVSTVIVNGRIVLDNGRHTGQPPGPPLHPTTYPKRSRGAHRDCCTGCRRKLTSMPMPPASLRRTSMLLACAIVMLASASPVFAQHAAFRLRGRVLTERGEPIPNAEVKLEAYYGYAAGT